MGHAFESKFSWRHHTARTRSGALLRRFEEQVTRFAVRPLRSRFERRTAVLRRDCPIRPRMIRQFAAPLSAPSKSRRSEGRPTAYGQRECLADASTTRRAGSRRSRLARAVRQSLASLPRTVGHRHHHPRLNQSDRPASTVGSLAAAQNARSDPPLACVPSGSSGACISVPERHMCDGPAEPLLARSRLGARVERASDDG
jgi:hypothetical protein